MRRRLTWDGHGRNARAGRASSITPAQATSIARVHSPDLASAVPTASSTWCTVPPVSCTRCPTNPSHTPHRCIRQAMLNISRAENWREKHNIMYGDRKDIKGDYSELLGRSTFCFVLPGEAGSA